MGCSPDSLVQAAQSLGFPGPASLNPCDEIEEEPYKAMVRDRLTRGCTQPPVRSSIGDGRSEYSRPRKRSIASTCPSVEIAVKIIGSKPSHRFAFERRISFVVIRVGPHEGPHAFQVEGLPRLHRYAARGLCPNVGE